VSDILAVFLGSTPLQRRGESSRAGPAGASPRAFAGSYLLYDGILEHFAADGDQLYHVRGGRRVALDRETENVFVAEGRRYIFEINGRGGVRIVDAAYDAATTENSVLYLARNDSPLDPRGPNSAAWSRLVGQYTGTFIGAPTSAQLSIKNGHLYLNGALRLEERGPGRFITADNEAVVADGNSLVVGNRPFSRR
jgi:hypothetical protein